MGHIPLKAVKPQRHLPPGRTCNGYLRLPGLVEAFLVNSAGVALSLAQLHHHHGAADGVEAGGVLDGVHGASRQVEAFMGPGELWAGVPAPGPTPQHQSTGGSLQGDDGGGHGAWGLGQVMVSTLGTNEYIVV